MHEVSAFRCPRLGVARRPSVTGLEFTIVVDSGRLHRQLACRFRFQSGRTLFWQLFRRLRPRLVDLPSCGPPPLYGVSLAPNPLIPGSPSDSDVGPVSAQTFAQETPGLEQQNVYYYLLATCMLPCYHATTIYIYIYMFVARTLCFIRAGCVILPV